MSTLSNHGISLGSRNSLKQHDENVPGPGRYNISSLVASEQILSNSRNPSGVVFSP